MRSFLNWLHCWWYDHDYWTERTDYFHTVSRDGITTLWQIGTCRTCRRCGDIEPHSARLIMVRRNPTVENQHFSSREETTWTL